MKRFFALAGVVALATPAFANDLHHLPQITDVAPQSVAISPHVPHMGEHFAHPGDLPTGPIYCVIEGRVVCVEYMFTAADLAAGLDWTGLLPGFTTPPISHIDLEHKPEGVGPFAEPLYQLHVYFVAPEVLAAH